MVLCLSMAAVGGVRAANDAVGEVSFTIGVSHLIDGGGRVNAVVAGMSVRAGDRIETESGGHVHLRFIDGANVSVRPGSRLSIETYRYDPARPQDSAIRFRLEAGVARVISGKGTESARERFRLNTPIAAIGVRGTDFVVLVDAERVRVAVNSGAIVLAPLGEGCAADAFGPCATPTARALSADMGQVMLELQRQQGAPRLVPLNGALLPDRLSRAPEEPRGGTRSSQTTSDPTTEVLATRTIQGVPPAPVAPPTVVPPPVALPPSLPPATLVWGRWAWAPVWPGDTLGLPYDEASAGRRVTVGNLQYALFRPEPPLPVLVSNLGQVEFTLRDAQVHLLRGNVAELGTVHGAWLSVNFAGREFATGVNMSHPQVGAAALQVAGRVQEDGIFAVRTANGVVAGALSLDGKEAGYLFERLVTGGTFVGITRWGR